MMPGSLDLQGETWFMRASLTQFKTWIRRYFWLWIVYQTVKGALTTTVIWLPLLYMWWQ